MSFEILGALLVGFVQGVAEFLPVSSSLHTSFIARFYESEAIRMAILGAEAGTFLALLGFFAKLILRDFREVVSKVFVGSLPIAAFILVARKGDLISLAPFMLILGAILMFLCEKLYRPRYSGVSYLQALIIGIVQILAVIPGVSRSGATIVCGLFLGVERKRAVEFAFLLSLPAGFASVALGFWKAREGLMAGGALMPLITGFVAAFIVACFAIRPCLGFLSRHTLFVFAIYRIALGCFMLLSGL